VADADVFLASEYDAVYIDIDPTSSSVVGLMDVKSIDTDGFTCIMDDADPSGKFVWYLALGVAPAGTSATAGLLLMGIG
jgi:hypothetical protein